MGVLSDLGFDRDEQRGMLIDPPDHALAEAGALKPRPSVASGLMTAEPAARVAWWPAPGRLDDASMSRLHWMVTAAAGEAWLVFDPGDEDSVGRDEVKRAVDASAFVAGDEVELSSGERALRLSVMG